MLSWELTSCLIIRLVERASGGFCGWSCHVYLSPFLPSCPCESSSETNILQVQSFHYWMWQWSLRRIYWNQTFQFWLSHWQQWCLYLKLLFHIHCIFVSFLLVWTFSKNSLLILTPYWSQQECFINVIIGILFFNNC